AENWWFCPHWKKDCDTADPRFASLYGEPHNEDGQNIGPDFFDQARPSAKFLERWRDKVVELIDNYGPDMLWFDFGLRGIPEHYRQECLAYYYNHAQAHGREVVVTYKKSDLAPAGCVVDLEAGRMHTLTYHEWITDTSIDDIRAWGYMPEAPFKSVTTLVHYLID